MARHFPSPAHSLLPDMACRLGMVVLLGMVLLLFSVAAVAHIPFSTPSTTSGHTGSSHAGIQPLPDVAMHAELVGATHPTGPYCHHGHGTLHAGSALLRLERFDLEFASCPWSRMLPATAPMFVVSHGSPRAFPDPSPVPVYLLTQRLRP